jgi:hypothetical protein
MLTTAGDSRPGLASKSSARFRHGERITKYLLRRTRRYTRWAVESAFEVGKGELEGRTLGHDDEDIDMMTSYEVPCWRRMV